MRIDRYTTIDDVGRAVNPLILHGQTHGGIVQGAGQALMERMVYDRDGQLLSGSFMDYAMPRADDFPMFVTALSEVPSTNHPLGFRGGGEGGITPALGVIINAVVDALAEFGVTHIDMPASPERVWRAIQAGDQVDRCRRRDRTARAAPARPRRRGLLKNGCSSSTAARIAPISARDSTKTCSG